MKAVLLAIVIALIVFNFISFYYGKKKMKSVNENGEISEEDVKKGIKYMIFSAAFSFITLIIISIVMLANLKL